MLAVALWSVIAIRSISRCDRFFNNQRRDHFNPGAGREHCMNMQVSPESLQSSPSLDVCYPQAHLPQLARHIKGRPGRREEDNTLLVGFLQWWPGPA